MLGGFPSYILKKYIELLIIENYTVVLCEQVTPPPKPKREPKKKADKPAKPRGKKSTQNVTISAEPQSN